MRSKTEGVFVRQGECASMSPALRRDPASMELNGLYDGACDIAGHGIHVKVSASINMKTG